MYFNFCLSNEIPTLSFSLEKLLWTVFFMPNPNIFSKFNPVNIDTPLIRTLSKVRVTGIWLYTGVTLNQYNQTPLIRILRGH